LETTNEELQSTNEELETMNEELQSTNEELQAMNDELRSRGRELNTNNTFLEAVFTGLRSGVIVVDRYLRIQVWNAAAADLWGVRGDETRGRLLADLDIGLPVRDFEPPIREILSGARQSYDTSVSATNRRGRTINCHVTASPLLAEDHALTGVILLMEER
jgi:two-component system, chemotaxis family, CheB/CheR fusion protein